jgi:hypothetical protein
VIPSHHNYPADAEDQLAETASSVIGIKRGAMVTRWASDHARYGVVDPETDSVGVDQLEGIGKRLTLRGPDDAVLASYIIGKKVEGESDQYYVRHPGEDETYIAELNISLSTKFTDWVNTDLLDIDSFDVRRVDLNDYSFDELRGTVTGKVESKLSRESSSDDWKMEGIDEETQEVDQDAMRDTVNELANLELAGVRPKQPGLTADLKLDRSALKSQRDVDRLQSDLLSRGFLLQPSQSDPETLTLISREGEMSVGTEDGLQYKLHFGRVFTGSEEELEIGLTSDEQGDEPADKGDDDDSAEEEASEDKPDSESTGGDEADEGTENSADEDSEDSDDEEDADSSNKPGRYVFVRVDFNQSLLGDQPKPVEPEMPEELKEAEKKEAETDPEDADSEADDSEDEQAGESDDSDQSDDEASKEKESEEDKLQKIRDEYNDAKQKYQDDVKALEEFDEKVKEGKEKAEELNRRFAQWYYVIPGDSYDKLSLSRDDLVKDKEKEEDEDKQEGDKQDGDEGDENKDKDDPSEGPSIDSASLAPPTNTSEQAEPADVKKDDPDMKQGDSDQAKAEEGQPESKQAAEEPKPDAESESKTDAEKETAKDSSDSGGKDEPEGETEPVNEDKPNSGGDTPEEKETPSENGETDSSGDSSENERILGGE